MSFANCSKSIYWSSLNNVKPNEVSYGTDKKYLFDCECGHIFSISPNSITSGNKWCGFCSNPPKKLCDNKDCKKCLEKSFASHPKSAFWSNLNNLMPRQIFKSSEKKIFIYL